LLNLIFPPDFFCRQSSNIFHFSSSSNSREFLFRYHSP
jgi:hypothetical protein